MNRRKGIGETVVKLNDDMQQSVPPFPPNVWNLGTTEISLVRYLEPLNF
jgi:hypothetical protein